METIKSLLLIFFSGLESFTKVYIGLLTIRIYISWFPNINNYEQPFLSLGKMTDPYLRVFRGLLPAIMGIDLSPILGFLLLTFVGDFCRSFSFAA